VSLSSKRCSPARWGRWAVAMNAPGIAAGGRRTRRARAAVGVGGAGAVVGVGVGAGNADGDRLVRPESGTGDRTGSRSAQRTTLNGWRSCGHRSACWIRAAVSSTFRWRPARRNAATICGLVSLAPCSGVKAIANTARASGSARLVCRSRQPTPSTDAGWLGSCHPTSTCSARMTDGLQHGGTVYTAAPLKRRF
jgi:hypothetical protein